ncbi:MAG TPA: mandelate racemase/muconate lactonizing enzyme family protein [Burkholderiales bacterium]
MKITRIKGHALVVPLGADYWVANEMINQCGQIIIEVETDEGVVGLGTLHGRYIPLVLEMLRELDGFLKGMDAMAHEAIWQKVFDITTTSPGNAAPHNRPRLFASANRQALLIALGGIDVALWDIKGKATNMPVWRLLGGTRKEIHSYVTGGYYWLGHDHFYIAEEMAGYIEQGFTGVKMKVGGVDLATDVARVKAVRDAIGPKSQLMVDANCAYDWNQAVAAIRAFEPYDIFWFEEPMHWYDSVRSLGQLAQCTHVALASGESEMHSWACRDLIDLGGVRYMEFDASRSGGVTEWLRVAAYAKLKGVQMATHHDAHFQGHLAAAASNGYCVEVFPNPKRDPLWDTLFTHRAQLKNGKLVLGDEPGFGFGIDWKTVEKYRVGDRPT